MSMRPGVLAGRFGRGRISLSATVEIRAGVGTQGQTSTRHCGAPHQCPRARVAPSECEVDAAA